MNTADFLLSSSQSRSRPKRRSASSSPQRRPEMRHNTDREVTYLTSRVDSLTTELDLKVCLLRIFSNLTIFSTHHLFYGTRIDS